MTDLNITEEENWDIIYQLPFKSILSTKLQSFQYKLGFYNSLANTQKQEILIAYLI
jgi:hypothetical protein